jgi:hypothetical protein
MALPSRFAVFFNFLWYFRYVERDIDTCVNKPVTDHLWQDRAIEKMTFEDWTAAVKPKVDGTWNLHQALGSDLDFFVMSSSHSGLMGQYGQANYASGNSFLDAFAQYRHSKGLSASVIDLGVVDDIGFVAESSNLMEYFRSIEAYLLSEDEVRDSVRLAIARSFHGPKQGTEQVYTNPSQIAVGVSSYLPLADANNRVIWRRDRRFSVYRALESSSETATPSEEGLKSFMSQLGSRGASGLGDDAVQFLAKEIGSTLYGFMMKEPEDMEMDKPLSALGLDSLVGIELRNWCKTQIGLEISILEIMQSTLIDVGKKAVESLVAKHG